MKKNLQKLLVTFFAIFVIAICYKVPVEAADVDFRMISNPSSATSVVTVSWGMPVNLPYDTTLVSCSYDIKDVNTGNYLLQGFMGTSFSKDVGYGYVGYWKLCCNYSYMFNNTGNVYSSSVTKYIYVNTTPATISKKYFGVTSVYSSSSSATIQAIKPTGATGVQLLVYNGTKCIVKQTSTTGYFNIPASKNKVYRYYVRAYYTNNTNKKTYYGKWSSARQFVNATVSGKSKSNKKGFSLTLKKISGVRKYKIYVSTNSKSGYKLSKTLNIGSKSKYTVQITKNVKKRKINYIRVIPEIKGYGNSDVYYTGSIYVYK